MPNKDERRISPRRPADGAFEGGFAGVFRVLVVDDHAVVRRGLRSLLAGSQLDLELREAATVADALEQVKSWKPHLVLMDISMPDMDGLDATRAIRTESPDTEVLILSMHFSDELAREAFRAGALGYVRKEDEDEELLSGVDHARRHKPFFTPQLAETMAQRFLDPSLAAADANPLPGTSLTQREVEVMQQLAAGKSNKTIAAELKVSTRTIESHRNRIMRKMEFANYSELVRYAVRSNLIEP